MKRGFVNTRIIVSLNEKRLVRILNENQRLVRILNENQRLVRIPNHIVLIK